MNYQTIKLLFLKVIINSKIAKKKDTAKQQCLLGNIVKKD